MGYYADDAIMAGLDEWRGSGRDRGSASYWGRSRDLPPQYCHSPKRCNRCHAAPLYWEQHAGKWRLHAYEAGKYVLHTCASAIEAATAGETPSGSTEGESAVPQGDAR